MFSLAVLALASIASSNALAIPRSFTSSDVKPRSPPGYADGYLEDYKTYHIRYIALNCQDQHDTAFFDDCCHPMLATENLKDNRKPECTPSPEASSSASSVEPTSTITPSGDDDCDDDDNDASTADPTPTPAAPPKNVAPAPTPSPSESSSSEDKPKPSASSSSDKPKPSSDGGDKGGVGGLFDNIIGKLFEGGIATFFLQNNVAGHCGQVHQDTDYIVALPTNTYGNGEHCGKTVLIQDTESGKSAKATVADSCPTCNNDQCLDMSSSLFQQFADEGKGTFNIKWGFVDN